jgi:hypothetical protein
MATIQFDINGLNRHQDGERLARSLAILSGVTSAHVHSATGTVTLTSRAHPLSGLSGQARAAVRAAGYEVASEFVPHTSRVRRRRWMRPSALAMRAEQA